MESVQNKKIDYLKVNSHFFINYTYYVLTDSSHVDAMDVCNDLMRLK